MQLIRNKHEWDNYKNSLPSRYNLINGEIKGEPKSFPTIVDSAPGMGVNGHFVKNVFFYLTHAHELINSIFHDKT